MELTATSLVYAISVAAQLTGVDQQMLRAYEARGLIEPHRTDGGTRRFSNHDVQLVQRITALLGGGLNLAGIAKVLELEAQVLELAAENHRLQAELGDLRSRPAGSDETGTSSTCRAGPDR